MKTSLAHCVLLHLLFLSQLVHYSAGESRQHQICSHFLCGGLGSIGFPFFRVGHPRCGVVAMNCTREPKAQFHEKGKWYGVKYINTSSRRVEIHDPIVEDHLASNRCDLLETFTEQAYLESFTEKTFPFVSFKIKETRPFIKCPNQFDGYSRKDDDLKFFHQFDKYSCNDYCFYSKNQEKVLPSLPKNLSHYCSVVFLTFHKEHEDESGGLKYKPMGQGATFIIDWKILPACLNCFVNGGDCLSPNGGFKCSKNGIDRQKGPKRKKKALIGVGTGLGGILLTCIVFIVYKRLKRKRSSSSSALISRDLSRDSSSLKPDPEKGGLFFETKLFTYKELDEATNHFDSSKELGDGGFGTVYHGKLHDGRVVAVKRLYEHNYKRVEQFMNEIEILSRLRHQNLVSLYGCTSRHSRELLLVYEFVPNGTVADHLHGERVEEGLLTWPIRMSIAIQSADALAYLHASEIIHRDVKSNNILLDNSFHVKVADFGLSRLFPMNVTHVSTAPQGTPGYVDPEYYQCYQLTNKSDVYSFGVVLIELISSKPAVDISRHRHEINLANMAVNRIHNQALHELVDPSLGYDTDYSVRNMITLVAELAFRCLQQENEMRPCMTEVLEILRGIEKEEYKKIKTDDMDTSAVARLLKTSEPLSPDTVTGKWPSKNTTPNTSG